MQESAEFKKKFFNLSNPANKRFLDFEINNGLAYDMGGPVNLSMVPDDHINQIMEGLQQEIEHVKSMNLYFVERDEAVRHCQARIDRFREYKQWRIDHGFNP